MNHRAYLICTKEHKVDATDDGVERKATIGMKAEAERDPSVPPEASNAYQVQWENGAWGFYSSEELAAVADLDWDVMKAHGRLEQERA